MFTLNPTLQPHTDKAHDMRPPCMPSVAVIIPCLNEAQTIAKVIADVRSALPESRIYVYDNNSTDQTADIASAAGAVVRKEVRRGKGRTLKKAFGEVEADIFVTLDGDDTYDASRLPEMIERLQQDHLDMLVGDRLQNRSSHDRTGHYLGNRLFSKMISTLFDMPVMDPFSGMRVMSRRFIKSFPSIASGFEVEVELTIHAFDLGAAIAEIPVDYRLRPEDSHSKLRTLRDGTKIFFKLFWLYQLKKPLQFYGYASLLLLILSCITFAIPLIEFITTEKVSHFPTLIVSMGGFVLTLLTFAIGLISENINSHSREIKRFIFRSSQRN
ncbi:glycosyltransferase family 2 protein [Thiomicrorhabdus xiamenensis]|uniref:Glycosyltransferase n=1 Tax=Thiomicrorhabdus xiamenensis TaxID=2739063 RepID=A0A7D4P3V0_9GAMM|nr:glycosyltransferase family 2 protein [Thiomicrorhabdus xiamenensis]QKI88455.1 glycosyltransferase [Thiomicrorhabdus xiamenensis]